jgi:hypothetical protein
MNAAPYSLAICLMVTRPGCNWSHFRVPSEQANTGSKEL